MARRDNAPKTHKTSDILKSNEDEWKEAVGNLKRRIKDLEGLGAVVDFTIPDKPEDITEADIERIKSIKRKELLEYASQVDKFGELKDFVPPTRGWTKQRREKVKREREEEEHYPEGDDEGVDIVDVELDNLRTFIENFDENKYKELQEYSKSCLLGILDMAIERAGKTNIARTAEEYASCHSLAEAALWASRQEKADMHIRGFSNILLGRPFTYDEAKLMEDMYEGVGSYA